MRDLDARIKNYTHHDLCDIYDRPPESGRPATGTKPCDCHMSLLTDFKTALAESERQLEAIGHGSASCDRCRKPVIFEFTVESIIWNRIVREHGYAEYLCFWCFDELAFEDKRERRIPVGVNISGQIAFSSWCGDDVPGAYPDEQTRAQLQSRLAAAEALLKRIKNPGAWSGAEITRDISKFLEGQ